MSYSLYDPTNKRYLGDVASIGGWAAFRTWVLAQHDLEPVVRGFVLKGGTSDPQKLATALHAMVAQDKDVNSVRQQLAFLAGDAPRAIVLSDGTEDFL